MMTAGFADKPLPRTRLKVATKYPRITRRFFLDQGRQVELIKLYGSMELAPVVGLTNIIVDLVDSGNTLRANGLTPLEHIMNISSRLIVNRASLKMKNQPIKNLVETIEAAVN
jgi:ATP phosphoribosyltransferase